MRIPENFIFKTLSQDITAATVGSVTLSDVDDMVAGTAGNPQRVVITDSMTSPTKWEIAYYSTIGSSTINITARGQEGTTAQSFDSGSYVYQAVTNALLEDFALLDGDNEFTGSAKTEFNAGVSMNVGGAALGGYEVDFSSSDLYMYDSADYLYASNANIFFHRNSLGGTCGSFSPYSLSLGNASGTTAGHFDAIDGGTNKPAYTTLYDDGGTAHYLFFDTDGKLREHSAIPTANTDGTVVGGRTTIATITGNSTGSHAVSLSFAPRYIEFYLTGVTGEAGATPLYSKAIVVNPNLDPSSFEGVSTTGGHYMSSSSPLGGHEIGYLNYSSGDDTVVTLTSWDSSGFTYSVDTLQAGTTYGGYYIAHE